SGYVGKLFREFAVAVSVALVLSLVISRTLTPMMCAYVLKPESKEHGWFYRVLERGFDILFNVYEAGLKIVLRHRLMTLMVMFATIALTGYLYVIIPKGFFPQQDTGMIIGLSEAAQDISYQAMTQRQQALIDAVVRDPAVASVGSQIGAGHHHRRAGVQDPVSIYPGRRGSGRAQSLGAAVPRQDQGDTGDRRRHHRSAQCWADARHH